jgi:formamidopyrimidine-DNA glycosylase
MPELPEVETIRATLSEHIIGKTFSRVDFHYSKILQNPDPETFSATIVGQTIRQMGRYGKYLFFILDRNTLISHLRMEGKFFVKPEEAPLEKHEHVVFHFTDGETLRYHDTRKFGTMELVPLGCERGAKGLCHMGLEPFDESFGGPYLQTHAHGSVRPVKSWLLDQTVISGLGNIYVNEVLFRCHLHPETPVRALKAEDFDRLADASRVVLAQAIELGGTTIRTYYSSLGVTGRFQNELCVHDKKGEPCPLCSTPIAKIQVGGRGTYYCPHCQQKKG